MNMCAWTLDFRHKQVFDTNHTLEEKEEKEEEEEEKRTINYTHKSLDGLTNKKIS